MMNEPQATPFHSTSRCFPEIICPKPIRHWSHYDRILALLDDEEDHSVVHLCNDPPFIPNTNSVHALRRERDWQRDWHNYRAVVRATPESTIAPPWPPFVAPPSLPPTPSSLPSLEVPTRKPRASRAPEHLPSQLTRNATVVGTKLPNLTVWSDRRMGVAEVNEQAEAHPSSTPEHARRAEALSISIPDVDEHPALRSCLSDSSGGSPDLVIETPDDVDIDRQIREFVINGFTGMFDDKPFQALQMFEDRPEHALGMMYDRASVGKDPLTDSDIYDTEMAHWILQRAAAARELENMLEVLPTG